jgi:hypothetical protein
MSLIRSYSVSGELLTIFLCFVHRNFPLLHKAGNVFCDDNCQVLQETEEEEAAMLNGTEYYINRCFYAGVGYMKISMPTGPSEEEIILNSSPFEIEWTPEFVNVKMKKYFGGYIAVRTYM